MNNTIDEDTIMHYYIRDHITNQPIACVSINVDEDGFVSRGIAICSDNERFDRKKARHKSRGRLIKALTNKEDSLPIRQIDLLLNLQSYFFEVGRLSGILGEGKKMIQYKSCYRGDPIEMELKMIDNNKSI